jgi:hypothetical protein
MYFSIVQLPMNSGNVWILFIQSTITFAPSASHFVYLPTYAFFIAVEFENLHSNTFHILPNKSMTGTKEDNSVSNEK